MDSSAFRDLIKSNAVIEFDPQGYILWVNDHFLKLLRANEQEIVGLHHSSLCPKHLDPFKEHQKVWSKVLRGQSQSGEFYRRNTVGEDIWIQGSYTPLKNQDGVITKIIAMAVDITEKKVLSAKLEQQNIELTVSAMKARAATHAKSIFLANMSHEIRTPLNSIIGITDALAETILSDEQKAFVETLQRANSQLMNLINDILDLSKIESGEIELRPRPFKLRKLLADVINLFQFRANEKGLNLELHVHPDVTDHILLDFDRLRQALTNLVNNALKFTDKGSVIVEVTPNKTTKPGDILFSISDTGIGISPENIRDIFLPFVQGDSTATRRHGGTGLGLSITKNLVQLLEGAIWVESKKHRGSVFSFTITAPEVLVDSDINSIKISDEYEFIQNTLTSDPLEKPKDILIVDDVEDNRFLLGVFLQKSPHRIYYANSGEEALRYIKQKQFDIIFMDVQMPGMDGHETTRHVRSLEQVLARPSSHIIACTANAFSEDIAKSLEAGCNLHLSKPIKKETLLKAIRTIDFKFKKFDFIN